ncbi:MULTISPECIES: hypothetical protein [Vibrio]|uniref:DUF3304 domain-containing protein n=1 Tax=Vibrio cholerae TaxID=666 RepID=A0A395U4Q6_VIBCL|nr:hypothetical protein [Vibrio cholerae]MDY7585239.1 hypothetical protein [Vibrio cholerae]RGP91649.1 hypothetical protein BC355_00020 [Vibrio cholerae]RGP91983.1 hypothetical protein BC354_00020 [Vibrio cholerae]RGP92406.1 hypothetical protein BC353_00020 [Vibrio cholerae]RGP95862.1 hypothetical protein BC352_00020 [Vibrio cholerae]
MRKSLPVLVFDAIWTLLPRWGRWLAGAMLVGYLVWFFAIKESFGGAKLVLNNLMDRPISYIYVNGNMGPNAFAFDGLNAGGKIAGSYDISGKTVTIEWMLSMTQTQYNTLGYRPEKHKVTLPMPERKQGDIYFYTLIMPNNEVQVRWSPKLGAFDDVIATYQTRKY